MSQHFLLRRPTHHTPPFLRPLLQLRRNPIFPIFPADHIGPYNPQKPPPTIHQSVPKFPKLVITHDCNAAKANVHDRFRRLSVKPRQAAPIHLPIAVGRLLIPAETFHRDVWISGERGEARLRICSGIFFEYMTGWVLPNPQMCSISERGL